MRNLNNIWENYLKFSVNVILGLIDWLTGEFELTSLKHQYEGLVPGKSLEMPEKLKVSPAHNDDVQAFCK